MRGRAGMLGLLAAASLAPAGSAAQSVQQTDPGGLLDRLAGLTEDDALSIGGLGYFRYWYRIDGDDRGATEGQNTFELWRLYLTLKARMTEWLGLRVTLDAGPESSVTATTQGPEPVGEPPPEVPDHTHDVTVPGNAANSAFVKFAYFDVGLPFDLSIQAGVIPSVWTGRMDDFWGFRFVAREAFEEEKLLFSADIGGQLAWKMPLGIGETVLALVNGTGFRSALDGDEYKTLQARVTFTPLARCCELFKTLELGAFLSFPLGQDGPRNQLAAFLGYKHDWFRVGYEFFYQDDQSGAAPASGLGHAAFFRFQTPWGVGALARFAIWDADVETAANVKNLRLYAGVFYQPVRFLILAAVDSVTWYRDGPSPSSVNTFLLSTEFRF